MDLVATRKRLTDAISECLWETSGEEDRRRYGLERDLARFDADYPGVQGPRRDLNTTGWYVDGRGYWLEGVL